MKMKTEKIYVAIDAHFNPDGKLIPTAIIWTDVRRYAVDRVLDTRRAASLKAGGVGVRYTVRIQGKERFLWYEGPKWFVEGR